MQRPPSNRAGSRAKELTAVERQLIRTHRVWYFSGCALCLFLAGVWLNTHVNIAMHDFEADLDGRAARAFAREVPFEIGLGHPPYRPPATDFVRKHLTELGFSPEARVVHCDKVLIGHWMVTHGQANREGSRSFAHVAWRWVPLPPTLEALIILPGPPPDRRMGPRHFDGPHDEPPPPPPPSGLLAWLLNGRAPVPPPPGPPRRVATPPGVDAAIVNTPLIPVLLPTFALFGIWVFGGLALMTSLGVTLRGARGGLAKELDLVHAKANFTAMVSHELKAPVAVLRLYAEMLRDGLVGESKRAAFYATMADEAIRLQRLVDDLLDLGKIQAGTKTYKLEPVALDPIIEEAISVAETAFPQRQASVSHVNSLPGLVVLADRRIAVQAIANVIHNALKYGAGQPVEVVVEVDATHHAHVHVLDRGPGIPADQRARIFEPYVRIGDEDTREHPGTGLGLALVQAYMQGHDGGSVAVAERPGGGSIFTLTFRALQEGAAA